MKVFRAHGKLLISAEYMVLHGSLALALPLKKGQSLERIRTDNPTQFSWNAYHEEHAWFSADFNPSTLEVIKTSDPEKADHLRKLLRACVTLDPRFKKKLRLWDIETRLDFSPDWGFGSSSSLIAVLAQWAGIQPLDLHFMVSLGSGYDVACAISHRAIFYSLRKEKPLFQEVDFDPPFASRLYFVWLGTKQPTTRHLMEMAGQLSPEPEDVRRFTHITRDMIECTELSDFQGLMEEHEARLSELIKQPRVSETRFPGLQGSVKSLGAWGGDFAMIATDMEETALYNYLDGLGLGTRFRFKDLVYGF